MHDAALVQVVDGLSDAAQPAQGFVLAKAVGMAVEDLLEEAEGA